jgi:signal transduction histidine kinase/ligand-binding sensor domain-containing protein/DNA-binding response OmpR family regulator
MNLTPFKKCLSIGLTVCLWAFASYAQTLQYQFERIDMTDGLSHHMVNDIFKDSTGFIWFATSAGLNRFDGHSMKVFRNIPGDTTSLPVDDVTNIFEGPEGKMWIYTHSGHYVFDPLTETFLRNPGVLLKSMSIADGLITSITKDASGNYWFIHYNQGLFRYSPRQRKTVRLQADPDDPSAIATWAMSALAPDHQGNMWIIHQNGIFEKLDKTTNRIIYRNEELKNKFKGTLFEYNLTVDADGDLWLFNDSNFGCFYFNVSNKTLSQFHTASKVKLNSNIIRKIVQDDDGIIWIATDNGGVNLLDKQTWTVKYLVNDEEDGKSLSGSSIPSMLKDNQGIIWLGTYNNGVCYYHKNIFRFLWFRNYDSKPHSLPFNDINAFAEDEMGNIWIGTNGGGLIYYNRKTNTFKQYLHDPADPASVSNNVIVSLLIDHEKKLWVGTYFGGLNRFDGRHFTRFVHDPQNPKSLGDDSVWEIIEDSNNNLWLGTLKGGVDVYDRSKNIFYHYRSGDPNSIHTNYVPSLMEDRNGNIWIGTGYGLEIQEKQSGRFVHYLNDRANSSSISNNGILSIFQDSRGLIWVGTNGGLNLFNEENKSFRSFLEKDGLAHNIILTITEDDQHNLWMSTPKGLSKLIVDSTSTAYAFTFQNYDRSDGLQDGAFHENAVLTLSSGEIIVGGSNGFNLFQPSNIQINDKTSPVIFTDFQVFNESVRIGEEVNGNLIISRAITEIDEIILEPANNVFSLEFAALNFFHAEKIRYRYILEGFNSGWLTTDASQRRVTFTNLDPGDYTFKVKASNSDGVWGNEVASVKIKILPPFWKTNFAFALYGLFVVGALLFVRWLTLTRARMNFRIQHERLEAQRMHELDMMKIKFFTNISHEFRTPLTLILTPVEKLLTSAADPEDKKHFQLIHRNARRLLNLVNQLLDFRKIEIQEIKLTLSEGDIVNFIRELVYSFSDLSEKKNIKLSFRTGLDTVETFFDPDKIEKIVFNLLSNAFKFTPENGAVNVDLNLTIDRMSLELRVTDTGIGIPIEKQEKIFERFFQHELPDTLVNQGSGIGLAITYEFVKLHGGSIEVESEPGKGSCFIVRIPLTEIREGSDVESLDHKDLEEVYSRHVPDSAERKPLLLLVEDNDDFRLYLKDNLKGHYSILEASNGKQGLQKALSSVPDLIVSDVMMPEMDGIQLCRSVKTDATTSHIPVILLTARTGEEQKIEGFDSGANDYITKPFNFEILQSRIRNLIVQQHALQKKLIKHFDVKASDVEIPSCDEKLIHGALNVVETNISNKDFSVEDLSRAVGMSRVLLYKKLLALTGKSPIEFIRSIRLQRAAQLLEKSQLTVAEVAYQVGFNNPKYFARYFREEYGMLPSLYASERKKLKKVE